MPVHPTGRLIPGSARPDTVSIAIDGRPLEAVAGESIAAALTANGWLTLRRDKNGGPRGMLCGMGTCFECRVSVNGGAAERACLTPVRDGMRIATLDYREPPATVPEVPKVRQVLRCDVLVVGAGPAGASAALTLAKAGLEVIVADERQTAGGQFFKQRIPALSAVGGDDPQYRAGRELIRQLESSGARMLTGTTIWGAFRDAAGNLELGAFASDKHYTLLPTRMIAATGAYESVPPVPGWTLPGVMTTGAAQTLLRAYRVAPGKRVLIAGNGPLNFQLAAELLHAGVNVVAVAEAAPAPLPGRIAAGIGVLWNGPSLARDGLRYLAALKRARVPLHYGHRVGCVNGESAVSAVELVPADNGKAAKRIGGAGYEVDAVCLGYRQRPSSEILRSLGAAMDVRSPIFGTIRRDGAGQTSVPGVYCIGDGAALGGAQIAMAEGRITAAALLERAANWADGRALRRQRRFQRNLWSLFEADEPGPPDDRVIVCRCESVTAGSVRALIRDGNTDAGSVKRRCRIGMGPCQGRYCGDSLRQLLAESTTPDGTRAVSHYDRNPVKPVAVYDLLAEKPDWTGYRAAVPPKLHERPASRGRTQFGDVDIVVIGAGIIGAATALYLARGGLSVAIVDRGMPNGEASGGNAGSLHLQLLSFDYRPDLGEPPAAAALPLQQSGIELWRQLEAELNDDFDLVICGGLMLAVNEADLEFLAGKAALEARYGIDSRILSSSETHRRLPAAAPKIAGAAYCAGEGKINPLVATDRLIRAAQNAGARLHPGNAVTAIAGGRGEFRVECEQGWFTCGRIVNAAGGRAAEVAALARVHVPVQTAPQQMLVTQPSAESLPYLVSLAGRHLTLKQAVNGNLIIGGGWPAGYETAGERPVTRLASIEGNLWVAQRVLPYIGGLQIIRSWAATGVMIDGAPIIDEAPECPGFHTVVGANGYTMGPALGRIVADQILGKTPLHDPAPFRAAGRKATGNGEESASRTNSQLQDRSP